MPCRIWNPTLVSRAASRFVKGGLLSDASPENPAYLLYGLGALSSSSLPANTELSRQKYTRLMSHTARLYLENGHVDTLNCQERVLLATAVALLPRACGLELLHMLVTRTLQHVGGSRAEVAIGQLPGVASDEAVQKAVGNSGTTEAAQNLPLSLVPELENEHVATPRDVVLLTYACGIFGYAPVALI